ncbi:hypothetical protein HanPSC8_Chr07g0303561 [Helianthus annuus]|nr:hypothetical protein HanIR_Chr07g0338921 [Helianthus annuus]KAJ0906263.1 hypothetical protein HanPSC8_Chr07g0303561 [Helianthus annuus]
MLENWLKSLGGCLVRHALAFPVRFVGHVRTGSFVRTYFKIQTFVATIIMSPFKETTVRRQHKEKQRDYWLWFTTVLVVGVKLAAEVVETGHGWIPVFRRYYQT